jgi:hypothetical protein
MRAKLPAVLAFGWLGICAANLSAQYRPEEYPQARVVRMEQGYLVLEQPRASARVAKRVTAPEEVTIGAHLDTPEGRFYLTDWSVARRREGKSHFWLWVPQAKAATPAPAAAGDWRKSLVRYGKVRSLKAPHGYTVLSAAAPEGRGKAKVLKQGAPDSSVNIAAELRINGDILYLSDWSLERFDNGLWEPTWIILHAAPETSSLVRLNEPPGEPYSRPEWEGRLDGNERELLSLHAEPQHRFQTLVNARKLVPTGLGFSGIERRQHRAGTAPSCGRTFGRWRANQSAGRNAGLLCVGIIQGGRCPLLEAAQRESPGSSPASL